MTKVFSESNSATLLGCRLSRTNFDDMLSDMNNGIKAGYSGYISITNTESIYFGTRIEEHRAYINGADFSCCDGVAAVVAGKMLGLEIPRLHGPDLMEACCAYGIERDWSHFFYGGKEGVPSKLSDVLTAKYPGLITAGTHSPPFRELTAQEERDTIGMINDVDPDIIWVGLGLLKQEKWIADHRELLNARWMVGVGAAFDFHAGSIKRAPKFYRDLGMEWLYRVAFEPRMIKRNLNSALIFPQVFKELFQQKLK